MYQLALQTIVLMTVVTSAMGAVCILRGSKIFDLRIRTRNFMYVGSCCAMCLGFLGAALCVGSLVITQWHYVAATSLFAVGVFASAHIAVDLSDRLRILRRI